MAETTSTATHSDSSQPDVAPELWALLQQASRDLKWTLISPDGRMFVNDLPTTAQVVLANLPPVGFGGSA